MLNLPLNRNFNTILTSFLSYLPSRLLVVLNSLIIVPILAHMMSEHELGIFQLAIGVLNLVCTCSTDWIGKSALRFYEKYRAADKLDEFFSNIIWLNLFVYAVIFVCFFVFGDFVEEKFFISKAVLLVTLFLVIPTGIRQFLYQMLRVLERPFLYSFCIIIYQMSLLALFLVLTGFLPNVFAALFAMGAAMLIIDVFMMRQIGLKINALEKVNFVMLVESLKYALPQIITNTCIWAVLNINKYVFQYNHYFSDTAAAGVAYLFATSILTPLLSTFSFAVFPFIVKKYETKNRVKPYMTNAIQLYCIVFTPIIAAFCYYPKVIADFAFAGKYQEAFSLMAFAAVTLFIHELMKLFNIKYHLKNKTYIEMAVSILAGLICLNLNFILIAKFHLTGAGLAMLISMLILFTLNLTVQFKNFIFLNYITAAKTLITAFVISFAAYLITQLICWKQDYIGIVKLLLFGFLSYLISVFVFRKVFAK